MSDDPNRFTPPPDEFAEPMDSEPLFDDGDVYSGNVDAGMYEPPDAIVDDDESVAGAGEPVLSSMLIRWLAIAAVLIIALLLILRQCGPNEAAPSPADEPTATAQAEEAVDLQPTFTPTAAVAATVALEPTATPVPPTPEPAPAKNFQPGAIVGISGTDGQGIRFRAGPGRNYITYEILKEGVTLTVISGPELADGITWWQVETESGDTGWASEEFLDVARE